MHNASQLIVSGEKITATVRFRIPKFLVNHIHPNKLYFLSRHGKFMLIVVILELRAIALVHIEEIMHG